MSRPKRSDGHSPVQLVKQRVGIAPKASALQRRLTDTKLATLLWEVGLCKTHKRNAIQIRVAFAGALATSIPGTLGSAAWQVGFNLMPANHLRGHGRFARIAPAAV